jgi:hypothetical protein
MPGSLPRTNVGHGKNHNIITVHTVICTSRSKITIISDSFLFN